jgi:hypothetical protein
MLIFIRIGVKIQDCNWTFKKRGDGDSQSRRKVSGTPFLEGSITILYFNPSFTKY